MRFTTVYIPLISFTMIGMAGQSLCFAQTRVTSVEELRRTLAAGDSITVTPSIGQPVAGRLIRLRDADLDLEVAHRQPSADLAAQIVTLRFDRMQVLERRRDPTRNGVVIGAGVGAGFGGAMFAYGLVVDRNEIDEWAPAYLGAAAVFTGMGALIGWGLDAASSKPHITFKPSSTGRAKLGVRPAYRGGPGVALTLSF